MKKLFFCFLVAVFSLHWAKADQSASGRDLNGIWYLNDKNGYFGGTMEIENCTDTRCDFQIQSWRDQHICDIDGRIEFESPTIGVYRSDRYMHDRDKDFDYSVPVGITFELLSAGTVH